MKHIAVIFTCFNRAEYTMRCLRQLHEQADRYGHGLQAYRFSFYVCDDASTDGTAERIRREYPDVKLAAGGNLYWSRGMFAAMSAAREMEPDLYLMVNDDVLFVDHALDILIQNYEYYAAQYTEFGLVGNIIETQDRELIYGGRGTDGVLLTCGERNVTCMLANWNFFCVTRQVIERLGLIDKAYEHGFGDFDYSFLMWRKKIPIFLLDEVVGACSANSTEGTYLDYKLNKRARLKDFFSPKGMPIRSYFRFYIKNHGWKGLPSYIYGYISMIGYILLNKDMSNSNR